MTDKHSPTDTPPPQKTDLHWFPLPAPEFEVQGLAWFEENQDFGRLPAQLRPKLRESLAWVADQPSGVVIRFCTSSSQLALRVHLGRNEHFTSTPWAAEAGFDLYIGSGADKHFHTNLCGPLQIPEFQTECQLPGTMQEYFLYFPLVNPVSSLDIGIDEGAELALPASQQRNAILFYGSSITQGVTSSRPGLTYPARVCRQLDAQLLSFGFSGNALGDREVAQAIAELKGRVELEAFVFDYDHNAKSAEWLSDTHEPFFEEVRKTFPDLPILVMSSPVWQKDPEYFLRRAAVIQQTVENQKKRGDTRVHFLSGSVMFPEFTNWRDDFVDNLHPNDAGCARMAKCVVDALQELLPPAGST